MGGLSLGDFCTLARARVQKPGGDTGKAASSGAVRPRRLAILAARSNFAAARRDATKNHAQQTGNPGMSAYPCARIGTEVS